MAGFFIVLQTLGNILIRPLPDFDVSTNYSSSPKLNLLDDFAQIFYVLSEMLIPEYLIVDITAGILLLLGADIISSQESGDGEVEGGNAEVRLLKYINMQMLAYQYHNSPKSQKVRWGGE